MNAHTSDLATELHLQYLQKKLKRHYKADLVDLSLNGDWEEVVKVFEESNPYYQFRIPDSVREMYGHLDRFKR